MQSKFNVVDLLKDILRTLQKTIHCKINKILDAKAIINEAHSQVCL